jgi:hypothetical protein
MRRWPLSDPTGLDFSLANAIANSSLLVGKPVYREPVFRVV